MKTYDHNLQLARRIEASMRFHIMGAVDQPHFDFDEDVWVSMTRAHFVATLLVTTLGYLIDGDHNHDFHIIVIDNPPSSGEGRGAED